MTASELDPARLFPPDPGLRRLGLSLYDTVKNLPIVSPHGHTDAAWFADDAPFSDASALLITPDHYVFRMLYSQGIALEDLGIPRRDGAPVERDSRRIFRLFAANYHLFAGTPTRLWMDHALGEVLGVRERLGPGTADAIFDQVNAALATPAFRPRALFERFGIEVLATTESPLDPLASHRKLAASGWKGRVITAYRPDPVVDPEFEGFADNVRRFGELTGEDTLHWSGVLRAHRQRREYFRRHGATSTDHGHPTARTADLTTAECERLHARVIGGQASAGDAELYRAQMLTEMARMSVDDGLVMQIHPGSVRNHNAAIFGRFGRDKGADIPSATDYVGALRPLLDILGNERRLSVILFTLDETTYSRELAPLAGHYPILRLGPPWWFFDSVHGMQRFFAQVVETAGFFNTAGFNDDTRAFLSIPARHDVWRRMACRYLAELVSEHRIDEDEAALIAHALAYGLAKKAYRLD